MGLTVSDNPMLSSCLASCNGPARTLANTAANAAQRQRPTPLRRRTQVVPNPFDATNGDQTPALATNAAFCVSDVQLGP